MVWKSTSSPTSLTWSTFCEDCKTELRQRSTRYYLIKTNSDYDDSKEVNEVLDDIASIRAELINKYKVLDDLMTKRRAHGPKILIVRSPTPTPHQPSELQRLRAQLEELRRRVLS